MPLEQALAAILPFAQFYLGAFSTCHLNDLATGQCWGATGQQILDGRVPQE